MSDPDAKFRRPQPTAELCRLFHGIDCQIGCGKQRRTDTRLICDLSSYLHPQIQDELLGEAKHSLLSEHAVLTAAEVSTLLGSHSANPRQFANTKRKQGEILGVPVTNHYAYPVFQFDRPHRIVYPEIATVNELLHADVDPFGVFSWWVSPNTRIDTRAPYQLLGTADASALRSLAEAIVEPVG